MPVFSAHEPKSYSTSYCALIPTCRKAYHDLTREIPARLSIGCPKLALLASVLQAASVFPQRPPTAEQCSLVFLAEQGHATIFISSGL